jgi:hypothetical protein
MDHFGLDMTFLGIKQVSIIIFVLKIIFVHKKSESVGASAQVFLDSGCRRHDGGLV